MLVTAEIVAKQAITTEAGASVDSAPMSGRTHFVALEAVDSDIRYRMRPKAFRYTALDAESDDTPLPAGAVVIEPVYPGAVIAFLQVSQVGGEVGPFLPAYVPVLAL